LFSRSANASVGRFFEGATAKEQTCTNNSFRGCFPTETILGVHLQDGSSAWVSRTLPAHVLPRAHAGGPKVDTSGLQIESLEHELVRLLGLAAFPRRWQWRGWRERSSAGGRCGGRWGTGRTLGWGNLGDGGK